MALSSSTLIHFTKEKEALKGILEGNFKISFSKESPVLGNSSKAFYVPMVSFCDIPLSEIKDHIGKYGCYGIGLTKEWAARNGLNPVLYIQPESRVAADYRNSAKYFTAQSIAAEKGGSLPDEQRDAVFALAGILAFIKNYEGPLVRKSEVRESYRFSDEREWRYVPQQVPLPAVPEAAYQSEAKESTREQVSSLRLEFEPNDIKYIIIKDDSEIHEFIAHLRTVKSKYQYGDVERLTTRILTVEQIRQDI